MKVFFQQIQRGQQMGLIQNEIASGDRAGQSRVPFAQRSENPVFDIICWRP